MNNQRLLHEIGNTAGLLFVCIVLAVIFIEQLVYHDLPCPLCLLQRVCFIGIGLCFLLNLHLGIRPAHYGFMILVTFLGLAIAVRQITLHLAPDDPGYGIPFLGIYLYVWSAIAYGIILILTAVALTFDKGFARNMKFNNRGIKVLTAIFLLLILANAISAFIECGPHICPDNPVRYQLLS
ncbi:MAG: disulfide bond formation protein B [Legionella sp.]|nr:disulfide bond formation protein B [Legionella sp.]